MEDGKGSPPRGVVLHLEDDDDSRTSLCKFLGGAGYLCLEAKSPEEALQLASAWGAKLDLLIVDYDLGADETGTETVESISRRLGHSLPTIILTGNAANAEVPWLRNSPVWIASKPICPNALLAGVPPLVELRRAMRAATM